MKELWDSTSLRNLTVWKSTEQCSHVFVSCWALYFVASGGQSGWLDGWAARNAGWFSSSRSIRNMMGNGRKSTWNLCSNNHIKLHTLKFITYQYLEYARVLPSGIEHLWNEAAVSNWYFITNTVFASTCRQQLFNRWTKNTYLSMFQVTTESCYFSLARYQ